MKRKLWMPFAALMLVLMMGLSSCYVGYYSGPRRGYYHPRPHYYHHYHYYHGGW